MNKSNYTTLKNLKQNLKMLPKLNNWRCKQNYKIMNNSSNIWKKKKLNWKKN